MSDMRAKIEKEVANVGTVDVNRLLQELSASEKLVRGVPTFVTCFLVCVRASIAFLMRLCGSVGAEEA